MTQSKVLATIEGKDITEEEVSRFIQHLAPQVAMQFQGEEGMKQVAQELVNQELMYLDAKDQGFDKEEIFVEEMKTVEENVLKQYAINKVLQNVTVTDEDLKKFYDEHKEFYQKGESVTASHILVETEEEAKDIIKELEEISFEEGAQKYSSCPSKDMGGNLGNFERGSMVPEFEEVAFSMEVGNISEPVETQFGYHIIKLIEKNEAGTMEFEEVKPQIMQQVTAMKQQEQYLGKTEELRGKYKVETFF